MAELDADYIAGMEDLLALYERSYSVTEPVVWLDATPVSLPGRRLGRRLWRRVTVHFTPKHGSGLNQADIDLSLVSRGCLGSRRIENLPQPCGDSQAWNPRANRAQTRIRWQFTRRDARIKCGYHKNLSNRSRTLYLVRRRLVPADWVPCLT